MTTPTSLPDLPADGYVLARTSEEYQRLRRRARFCEPVTAQALDRVGIGPCMRCLEVGCGPGEVMRLMAQRVGPCGVVTGLDNDARLGREALEALRATATGQFEFIHTDAEATGEVAGGLRLGLCPPAAAHSRPRSPCCASCTPGHGRAV